MLGCHTHGGTPHCQCNEEGARGAGGVVCGVQLIGQGTGVIRRWCSREEECCYLCGIWKAECVCFPFYSWVVLSLIHPFIFSSGNWSLWGDQQSKHILRHSVGWRVIVILQVWFTDVVFLRKHPFPFRMTKLSTYVNMSCFSSRRWGPGQCCRRQGQRLPQRDQ